ncbi:hypothetical protein [Candidatus Uabimicrobium sp. HlEnr_7]|uniref:hypothetical protein n=1 Tax=Candidatus Uabimicrobium helgolandensis TaxID=3095367 RepID=UPI0035568489
MDYSAICKCIEENLEDAMILVTDDVGSVLHFNKDATEELAAMTAIISFNVKQLGELLEEDFPKVVVFSHEGSRYTVLFYKEILVFIKTKNNVMLSKITKLTTQIDSFL